MKIGKFIPKPIKRAILFIVRIPGRIKFKIYEAAARGKIPFPDRAFQKWDYKIHTGRKLNLRHPVTYQDKLQWMKYYYRNPILTKLVDKYGAREWVANKIGEEYLVPIYGIYNSWDEIDFSELPDTFVLKCTHDSGSVVICRDKKAFDFDSAKKKIEDGLARNQFYISREWPYKNVKPRIICEKFLKDDQNPDPPDYKFLCFDGHMKMMYVNTERRTGVTRTNYYTPEFERVNIEIKPFPNNPKPDYKPAEFEKMIELAEILSKGFPFIRVDFNLINHKIYFGEMTCYDCGGRWLMEPDEYNYTFGEWITLPPKMRNK